jgi:predicted nucleotidyltransferase
MKRKTNNDLFRSSNALKVLAYLIDHPGQSRLPGEILKDTGLSRVGIYLALRQLLDRGLIAKQQRGRFVTYEADHANPVVKQYKVMTNVLRLAHSLERLRARADKIVLFGSAGRGEDYPDSDIDLFVLTKDPATAADLLNSQKIKRRVQAVIKTPSEFAEFTESNPTFAREIERGIILWEARE